MSWTTALKSQALTTLLSLALMAGSQGVMAKGCIKGAAVGAVAGHVAGHHAVIGAAAGCVVGHHLAKKKQQQQKQQDPKHTASSQLATQRDSQIPSSPPA